ncbi:purine-cytosine permease family protein [Pseudomonas sp. BGr12]|uniref:purine-cytosine permease family protein n=1 Tax=Pseudomonas sp. BGr12 TaxID=2936269 RepID=UPI00255A12B6|nr:cytosine permease [Pseudomonas sp. BJa5]MDL2428439.1 cytosine permease [Pseudomonas sp. BJa5]
MIETHGIEIIPDKDRQGKISDYFRIGWSGNTSLSSAVLGAFPVIFGLSFWQGLSATILGLIIGSLMVMPMGLFAPVTGTNNAVSSSAHFGVVGRIVGSVLSLLVAVSFVAICVWSSGDALIGLLQKMFNIEPTNGKFAVAYGIFAAVTLIIAVYGYRIMLVVTKIAVIAALLMFIFGFVVFWPQFDLNYPGVGIEWGEKKFWAPFISATLMVLSNPISFAAFLGDWSRYLPKNVSKPRLLLAGFSAQMLAFPPFLFGLFTATIISSQAPQFLEHFNYMGGLIQVAPTAFTFPLLLLALLSGMSTGTLNLYGTGLDFSSVIPRFNRVQSTLFVGFIACVLIYVGRFAYNLVDAITTTLSLIVVMTTPWLVIMVIGFINRRGFYLPDALQVFNRKQEGGAYWFWRGWHVPAMTTWVVSATAAVMTVNMGTSFTGWAGNMAGGVDISLMVAIVLPAILYPLLLIVMPEPKAVFGPRGSRWFPVTDRPVSDIVPRRRKYPQRENSTTVAG